MSLKQQLKNIITIFENGALVGVVSYEKAQIQILRALDQLILLK